jgi:hypothetical protein
MRQLASWIATTTRVTHTRRSSARSGATTAVGDALLLSALVWCLSRLRHALVGQTLWSASRTIRIYRIYVEAGRFTRISRVNAGTKSDLLCCSGR